MKLSPIADRVAEAIYRRPISEVVSQETIIRNECDVATGGELSCSLLDRLCDMVERRLKNPHRYGFSEIIINTEQRLYVIPCGSGLTCLGFDVADRRARAVAAWLSGSRPNGVTLTAEPGTAAHFRQYRAVMEAGQRHHARTGQRCEAELSTRLRGLEGKRVEVSYPDGRTTRFYVGRSTGWLPCHLEIKRRNAHGGAPIDVPEDATVRVVGVGR